MRMLSFICALLLTSGTAVTAWGVDLTKIDRTINKEPAYQGKPKYCLLVFGPEANTRVWVVLDGEVVYVDRNGNGDLTEEGERHAGAKDPEGIKWQIGDIVEADGTTRHTDLRVRFERGSFILFLRGAQGIHQEVGKELGPLRFSDKPQDAPIVHLAGPLTFLLRTPLKLIPREKAHFIALIGTAGLGEGAAAYCHTDDFEKLKMVGEVEFPRPAPAGPVQVPCLSEGY